MIPASIVTGTDVKSGGGVVGRASNGRVADGKNGPVVGASRIKRSTSTAAGPHSYPGPLPQMNFLDGGGAGERSAPEPGHGKEGGPRFVPLPAAGALLP